MTRIYFVRHAESDINIHDELSRPLTPKGVLGSKKVTEFLKDRNITKAISSPYKRSIDTIKDYTDSYGLDIEVEESFRERKITDEWIDDFHTFAENQWNDFSYRLDSGECLTEVQDRNIKALHGVLKKYPNETIIIGTHGTALSSILHYYNNDFGYDDFQRIRPLMPHVVCLEFIDTKLTKVEEFLI